MDRSLQKKFKSGSRPRPVRWHYGKESDYYLLVKDCAGHWLKPLYSHDVANKSLRKGGRGTLPDTEKIARLKALFARGGTRGVAFQPEIVTTALIIPNGKSAKEAIEVWTPEKHWYVRESRRASMPETAEWKLWMNTRPKAFIVTVHRQQPDFQQFSGLLPEKRPDLCERYTDPDTGELSMDFVMALYLGAIARSRKDEADRAYLYRAGTNTPALRIDLASGRVCGIGQGAGWIDPAFFFNH